jgi:serine/threonine protein kinase/tetratricopeptide (TPR) repeat protein
MAETLPTEEAIFHAALEIDAADRRSAYLDEACGGHEGLRRRVEALLRRHAAAEGPLDRPAIGRATAAGHVPEQPGTVIGPYKLLEQIGEGGMGLVFMAEQTQPVRRRVALKVLKPGLDTRQVVARFEAERQALALMDHPHIARVFDGGTTDAGRPYFVMELVRGVPITEFCDQRRLTTRQRLELFVLVCQAVQHAHQRGIIHRDLKPSNVLVTLHDTVAVPKVIDFGVAKAASQLLTDRTLFTHFAQMVGTPLYMSPEQAEMNGLDVDTRSDVYSLGVLLYELLTGTTPFEGEALRRAGLDEMRRLIREEEPPTPSQRLHTLDAQECSTVSQRRGVDGRRLGQLLRGELDWIVMRALEKDRDRRYESASALAVDVQRYLSDEAVAACPPSAGYRLRKYARRNRRALVTAGVITVTLLAATAVSAWQAVVAREAQYQAEADRKQAEADRDRAKIAESRAATEAAIAQAVNEFLQTDLLGQAVSLPRINDEFGGGSNLTVREALDRAAARTGHRFQDQPLVEAAVRMAIANAYIELGAHKRGEPQVKRAIALRETHLGPDHPETINTIESGAVVYSWLGYHADAIAMNQRALEYRRKTLGPDHRETMECECSLGAAFGAAGQWEKGVPLLERLLAKQRAIFGPTNDFTIRTMGELAVNYKQADRLGDSIALYERILECLKSRNAPAEGYMVGLAQVYQRAGDLDRADKLFREALEQLQTVEETSHGQRNRKGQVLGWLALNLSLQQRYDEAEPLAREAIALTQTNAHYPFLCMTILGEILLGQQKYAEAEPLLLKGYEGMRQQPDVAVTRRPWQRRQLIEAGERVVRFYEVTNQPEKARAWRQRLKATEPAAASAGVK